MRPFYEYKQQQENQAQQKILYYSAHKRCTHFINTMQIIPGATHHFILQLYVYDFAVDKNWDR